jgi:hypothetical protein
MDEKITAKVGCFGGKRATPCADEAEPTHASTDECKRPRHCTNIPAEIVGQVEEEEAITDIPSHKRKDLNRFDFVYCALDVSNKKQRFTLQGKEEHPPGISILGTRPSPEENLLADVNNSCKRRKQMPLSDRSSSSTDEEDPEFSNSDDEDDATTSFDPIYPSVIDALTQRFSGSCFGMSQGSGMENCCLVSPL